MSTIDFWYEFASPYSFLAAMRVADVAKEKGVEVKWRPFLFGAIFKMMKLPAPPMQMSPQKFKYMWLDVVRQAKRRGLDMNPPPEFPRSGVLPSRVTLIGLGEDWGEEFSRRVFQANFVHGEDIATPDVIGKILEGMDQDAPAILEQASSQEIKNQLRAQTQEAFDIKIFGVPTFMAGDEMFWGDDRLELALETALAL